MVNRIVVGAHYGWRSWLAQRVTAVVMAVYSVILALVLFGTGSINYGTWNQLFAQGWMRVGTLLFAASLSWHAWIGVRDILMDYVQRAGVRLALQVAAILILAGYLAWTIQILWR